MLELHRFDHKLIGILRGYDIDSAMFAVEAAARAGVDIFEVAIRAEHEREDISVLYKLRRALPETLLIGAGTVLDIRTLNAVERCGVDFVVSPAIVRDIIALCASRGLPVIPGALTPTEICEAHSLGAFMVKLFPANALGVPYIKAIRAPLGHIPLVAMGGITPDNIADYAAAGVTTFGISTGLFKPNEIAVRDDAKIMARCRAYIEALG